MSNRLIDETSPYLLQHAHNPVDWFPWGEEALLKAKKENKPILVSIGYSACHWCHVMERESFENEGTAAIMNEHFVNIKIDREERPDLDHIYMDAVQAMTGSGGWPLNVFLTPDAKPFYGGTYFPPVQAFHRASWSDTLHDVATAFAERRHEIDAQAENLTEHLRNANSFGLQKTVADDLFSIEKTDEAAKNLLKNADREWGGFGKAPKFPQTFSIQFLLRYYHTRKLQGDPADELIKQSLEQAMLSLDKMIEGGIYDQAGGGFARYATDTEWLAPHFEKMLYDNALLVATLSEAYQLTKKQRYKEVIAETIAFVQRELMDEGNGFYAALDADSEGVEGKFYIWGLAEIKKLLGDEAVLFSEFYDVSEKGNWEHTNILRVKKSITDFAKDKGLDGDILQKQFRRNLDVLLNERNKRVRPGLDDKVILGWNALMNTGLSKAYAATGENDYLELALANMEFILEKFKNEKTKGYHHTWKNDQAKYPAFLDDYAFLIQALLQLQEVTGDTRWLKQAEEITELVIEEFSDTETPFFFYTSRAQQDLVIRKKEVYDGAVPAGNSVMANCLRQLGLLLDKPAWKRISQEMIESLGQAIVRYPTSFGNWAMLLQEIIAGTNEIVITGADIKTTHAELLSYYIPHRVLMVSTGEESNFPLLAGKLTTDRPALYLCRNYTCLVPVFSAKELIMLINKGEKRN